jgi:hypothetical protein
MNFLVKNSVSAHNKINLTYITWMYSLWEIAEFVIVKAGGTYTYYRNSDG